MKYVLIASILSITLTGCIPVKTIYVEQYTRDSNQVTQVIDPSEHYQVFKIDIYPNGARTWIPLISVKP